MKEWWVSFSFKKFFTFFSLSIILVLLGIAWIFVNESYVILWLGIGYGAFCILLFILEYYMTVNLNYARACEQNNGQQLTNIIRFFDNHIKMIATSTANIDTYSYSIIKKVMQSKNLIILQTRAKQMIIVEKAKFTIGNHIDLITFIKSRMNMPLPPAYPSQNFTNNNSSNNN